LEKLIKMVIKHYLHQIKNNFISQASEEKRNYGLDAMRGIGLLMVLIGHSLHFFDTYFEKIYRIAHFVMNGVELFFALSGFLIGGIIIRTFILKDNYDWAELLTFLKRRWYKTLPVYYFAILINYTIGYFFTGTHHDFNWQYLTFTHTLFKSDHWFFPISYSLSMEEWFYLIFPFLFIAMVRIFKNKMTPYTILLALCILYCIIAIGIRTYYFQLHPHWDTVMRKSLITRIDCSIYGVLMAFIFHKYKMLLLRYKNHLLILALILYAISIYFRTHFSTGYFYYVLYFTAIPLSFALMIPWFYDLQRKSNFTYFLFTYLSMISFAFYLFHLSPNMELFLQFKVTDSLITSCFYYVLYLIIVFSVATLWYLKVEKPITNLRNK
jgi:peptidoglycan/LPS O-acetylase OafA/YrhL